MEKSDRVKVWDPFVRVFHWSLLAAFMTASFTEFDTLRLHVLAGYAVLALVALRVVWGFIGGGEARFASFVHHPREIVAHLKDVIRLKHKSYTGHNPAAGAMAITLLIFLLLTTLTGLLTYGAKEVSGPFAALLINYGWRWGKGLEEVHHFLAEGTLALVFIHMTGAIVESILSRENLILPMFTGYKQRSITKEEEIL